MDIRNTIIAKNNFKHDNDNDLINAITKLVETMINRSIEHIVEDTEDNTNT